MKHERVFHSSPPVIETEHLSLSGHGLDDLEDCVAMWGDPQVTRYIGGRAFAPEETWARLLRYIGHWSLLGFGYWIIREKDSQRFVGEVGFADFRRDLEPSVAGIPEIGWALAPRAQGRGLASEAVRAAVTWGISHLEAPRSVCLIDPKNAASLRVAEKNGYREFQRTRYKGLPAILLERAHHTIP